LVLIPGQTIVDMTFGAGGHTEAILQSTPDIKVFAVDRDPLAFQYAQKLSAKYPGQVFPMLGRFSEVLDQINKLNVCKGSLHFSGCDFSNLMSEIKIS